MPIFFSLKAAAIVPTWLTNSSFEQIPVPPPIEIDDDVEPNTESIEKPKTSSIREHKERKHKKSDREKSSHKKKKRRHHDETPPPEPIHQFTGNEDFYVDKKPERGYLRVETLHRPACPKYHCHS